MYKETLNVWRKEFARRKFAVMFIGSVIFLVLLLTVLTNFLVYVEKREGVVLDDPILKLFEPVNLTWITFFVIYFSLFVSIIKLIDKPQKMLVGVQTYFLMVLIRICVMYFVPLEPPIKMIPLIDPVVEIIGGTGITLTKDLFFSGHTATMFILYLIQEKGWFKTVLLYATLLVGTLVVFQHVHYSIDVIVAFMAAYFAYRGAVLLQYYNYDKNSELL